MNEILNGLWTFTAIPVVLDAIAVMGLYVIANTGRLSVGQAAFCGLGGYCSAILSVRLELPAALSIAIGTVFAGLIGVFFAVMADRLSHWFFAITTLAFSIMALGLISGMDGLGGANGLYGVPLSVGIVESVLCLLGVLVLIIAIDHSPFGRRMRAVRDSEHAAVALGINPMRVRVMAFAIGSAIAGLAGGLWCHYLGLVKPSDLSLDRSLLFLVYLSLGGMEFWGGALLASIGLGLLPEALRFSREYRMALFGGLLTLVMVLRPAGLFGSIPMLWMPKRRKAG